MNPIEVFDDYERLFTDVQELVMKCRMISIGPTFRQHLRTVREAAMSTGKLVELVIEGEDVELDMSMIEHLRDPLTHLVRNSVDHGIELPDVRASRGKSPSGTIILTARYESGGIVIQIRDDGNGVDRQRVRERARSLGRLTDSMSDAELLRLILEPGFSTADVVTEMSGRGVGMDIVKKNVERIRGSIHVESIVGTGTTVTIRLPLTLAIIGGLTVDVADETFIIPLEAVRECLELDETVGADETGVMALRGQALPYLRLGRHFGIAGAEARHEKVVVVESRGQRAALVVDALQGETQTVVRPLTKLLQGIPGISGSAILGSGRVALILEVDRILDAVVIPVSNPAEPEKTR
jgi:two-component system chemotaxis sensor kinase CheA